MAWLAIYAVALHVIVLGLAPIAAGAAPGVDPFSVICHSVPDASADATPDKDRLIPSQACEHCDLCGAMAPPPAPDPTVIGIVVPLRVLGVLRPVSVAARPGGTSNPSLARGPPRFV